MKYASATYLFAVLASGSLLACASGGETQSLFDAGTTTGSGGATSGSTTSSSTGTPPITTSSTGGNSTTTSTSASTGGGTQCVSTCTSDSDCGNSCPATDLGSNCCDLATGVCYISPDAVCPTSDTSGSGGGSGVGGGSMY